MFNTKIHCVCCLLLTSVCASVVCRLSAAHGRWSRVSDMHTDGDVLDEWRHTRGRRLFGSVVAHDLLRASGDAKRPVRTGDGCTPLLSRKRTFPTREIARRFDRQSGPRWLWVILLFYSSFFPLFFLILYLCSTYTFYLLLIPLNLITPSDS